MNPQNPPSERVYTDAEAEALLPRDSPPDLLRDLHALHVRIYRALPTARARARFLHDLLAATDEAARVCLPDHEADRLRREAGL